MMTGTRQYDYDLFVIGGGSGGVRASRIAAGFGARVAVAEDYRVGGTCVIRGCVPKKLFSYAAHFHEDFEDARGYGWTVAPPQFSWATLMANKDAEIARLEAIYIKLLQNSGVELMQGRARVIDAHTVEIGATRFSAANLLIATGGWPVKPDIPGAELAITSNEAFELAALPQRVMVVGGGYIAVEFAGIFKGLGSDVSLSYRGEQILRGFDDDVRAHLSTEMAGRGVTMLLKHQVTTIARSASRLVVSAADGSTTEVDAVMFSTGRAPNTRGLGLEAAGVELDAAGGVKVDAYCRSSVKSIWAVGDVTNRIALTPVAIREGHAVARTLFGGGDPVPVDHADIPTAVFSQPQVGTVGLSESAALAAHGVIDVYKADFRPLKATLSGRNERTLMKLVVDQASQRVLGAHMVGADAAEIIQGVGIAVKAGLTKPQFDATVGIHPTAAEEFVTLREKRTVSRGEA